MHSAAPGDNCSFGAGTYSMQSAVPDVIGSSEAVPSGSAFACFPLSLIFLLHSAALVCNRRPLVMSALLRLEHLERLIASSELRFLPVELLLPSSMLQGQSPI